MCKKIPFSDTNFEKSPYRGGETVPHPSPAPSLPRFCPPLTNPGCTTITGIAKGTRGHAPAPLIGVEYIFKRRGSRGVGMSLHITNPLIMPFNVQEMSFSYTNFQKISLPWEGENPLPPLGHFAPLFWPPLTVLAAPLLLE